MGWSLDVLNVLVIPFDASVGKFFMRDVVFTMAELSGALPVPVESTHILQSGHLLIGQIGDDLQHTSTVAVEAEDILVEESSSPGDLLKVQTSKSEATYDPLSVLGVLPKKFFHYYFNLITKRSKTLTNTNKIE